MKRSILAIVCVLGLAGSAQAAPILTATTDGLATTVAFDAAFTTPLAILDVAGATPADVTDGGPITSGTTTVAAEPPPVDSIVFFDADDAYGFDFLFGSAVFAADFSSFTAPAIGSSIVSTDPLLAPFLGGNLATFSVVGEFIPVFEGDALIAIAGIFALDTIQSFEDVSEVPEPATLALVGTGLAYAARRRRAKKA